MPAVPPPPVDDLSTLSLERVAELVAARQLPPVETWHPARSGDSHMRIAADGSWYHEGGRINRPAMVRLFSTLLRREADGSHVLVTPAEKLTIAVEDTPFRAVEAISEGDGEQRHIAFRLDTGDVVVAGPDHPLRVEDGSGGPRPLLHVRGAPGAGLDALIARSVYYGLADWALADGDGAPAIWSGGVRFPLSAA